MMTREEARKALDDIGRRRRTLEGKEEDLRTDTKQALRATKGLVSRAEAARRIGLNRSTLYELYLGEEDENEGAVDSSVATRT